jgi:anti-sigma regulatory factor (Ser/Thr protein kinase)
MITTRGASHFRVTDSSQVGEARRKAANLANVHRFTVTAAGKLGLLVTEIAQNLVKHARNGELILLELTQQKQTSIVLIATDEGPGMSDLSRCMEDGYSTAGSPGTGLGAISRQSDRFHIFTVPNKGTILVAQVYASTPTPGEQSRFQVAGIALPLRGETECGDTFAVIAERESCTCMVADGLGHGKAAAEASEEAARVFGERSSLPLMDFFRECHGALRKTRGAAMAVARIEPQAGIVRFAGVGNIAGQIIEPGSPGKSLVSYNGTVGAEMRKVQEFTYPWSPRSTLILCSDGLQTRWNFDAWPGLLSRDPWLVAAALLRDFQRGRDDASVLVVRSSPAQNTR